MIDLENENLNFLDLETTGLSYHRDRIIEIYIVKLKNGIEIDRFSTLVNPNILPDSRILALTNISLKDLKKSPEFKLIAKDVFDFINNEYIVAHNARFDHSFLKAELQREGLKFKSKYICTVKLSKNLYPQFQRHNLDSLITRLNIDAGERHRASYDTEVVRSFFYHSQEKFGDEEFGRALHLSTSRSSVNANFMKFDFTNIPESSGVYIFKTMQDYPVYVGMSKNLKHRVLDHFYANSKIEKEYKITSQSDIIEIIPTAGELGAALRESFLIKTLSPLHNRALRRRSGLVKLKAKMNTNGYKEVSFERDSSIDYSGSTDVIGIYGNKIMVKVLLKGLIYKYGLCPKLLSLEKGSGACFDYHLGKCSGACVGKIKSEDYNKTFDEAFKDYIIQSWPFKSAIILTEESENLKEELLFDKWIFLGSSLGKSDTSLIDSNTFNIDTYKILKRYLGRGIQFREVTQFDKLDSFRGF